MLHASNTVSPSSARPLRIALFTGNYVHIEDGVSRTLGRLVGFLVDQGHEVLVLGPSIENPPVTQPGEFVPVPSIAAPFRPDYRAVLRFPKAYRDRVEAFRPDVIHLATPDPLGYAALKWARAKGYPVVATYHTHFASYLDYYRVGALESALWAILRRFYNRCDEVYVPTTSMREVLLANGITPTLRLWPRGVDASHFRPGARSEAWREAHGFAADDVVIAFVSRLVKEKGLDVYADVMDRLAALSLPVRALIVGDGPEREALQARLPSARFTGHLGRDALATAYASSDLFLFPSETETFGNVTLEAMASGLTPIVADATGSRDLVENRVGGLVCPARDVAAFSSAAERLVRDAAERAKLGSGARTAAETYHWTEILGRMVTYYKGVLDEKGSVAAQADTIEA